MAEAAEVVTWLSKLLLLAFLAYALIKWFQIAVYLLHDHQVDKRRELFHLWVARRVQGTWWEKKNAEKHVQRIIEEGPYSEYRGPWEEE